jgi:hypothetical protein
VNFLSIISSKTHMSSCMMTLAKIRSRSHAGDLASGKVAVCFDPGQTMVVLFASATCSSVARDDGVVG